MASPSIPGFAISSFLFVAIDAKHCEGTQHAAPDAAHGTDQRLVFSERKFSRRAGQQHGFDGRELHWLVRERRHPARAHEPLRRAVTAWAFKRADLTSRR